MLGTTLGTFYTQISTRKILSSQLETTGDKTKQKLIQRGRLSKKRPQFPLFLIFKTHYCYIFSSSAFV